MGNAGLILIVTLGIVLAVTVAPKCTTIGAAGFSRGQIVHACQMTGINPG